MAPRSVGQGASMGFCRGAFAMAGFVLALAGAGLSTAAHAQSSAGALLSGKAPAGNGNSRLLVEGEEIVYNRDKNTVEAKGDVELNYNGRTLQADRVIYDRSNGRVFAEGNVRLTETNGAVTTGDRFELTDDFKTGFIDSLRVEQLTKDRMGPVTTRFTSPRGERVDGDSTVFDLGTYTACEPCRDHPERPPLWQVKAARIVQNNEEHRIYYTDGALEFAGVPLAYIPYFWTPDPTVRRESGFLAPHYLNSKAIGYGIAIPYFWAISPDKDLTFSPALLSRQGVLGTVEYRQRLLSGSFRIRAAGIFQQGKDAFLDAPFGPGNRTGRGSVETVGRFNINERWVFGWDGALISDKWFLQNYKVRSESFSTNYFLAESTSTAYLTGLGDRSYFDLRGYYFQGLSYADWQKQLPDVAPVLDYDKRVNGPEPLGGELRTQFNFTNVHRDATQFAPTSVLNTAYPYITSLSGTTVAIPYASCTNFVRGACNVLGLAGDYSRASVQESWRRTFVDDWGQAWTPFAYLRADAFFNDPSLTQYQNSQITNFINGRSETVGRVIPAIGTEYRYPFIADFGEFGTHTITPIAQIIARPNEPNIGRLPNEDAHSLSFDDTNLFAWDKFSGYDRVEGGVRSNYGLQYNFTTPAGWTGNALFGQSYQVAGRNSYNQEDLVGTGSASGLDTKVSDYVARAQINPSESYSLITRGRFDKDTWQANAFEVQAVASLRPYLPIMASLTYARYAAAPAQGFTHRREGLAPGLQFSLTPNWTVGGSFLFDLDKYIDSRDAYSATLQSYANLAGVNAALANVKYQKADLYSVIQSSLSLAYRDECTTFSINYSMTPRLASTGEHTSDQTVLVRLELRTLGQTGFSQTLGTATQSDGISSK